MKKFPILFPFCLPILALGKQVPLFDGKSLGGWEGTPEVWRVENGEIHGGSMEGNPKNEFLSTKQDFRNFHLRFEYKLTGTDGFINGGVQFRSERIDNPPNEMSGYQADIGAGYTGSLYDESRRKKFLAKADPDFVQRLEKPGEWNSYEVVATGRLMLLFINGRRTCIFYERDPMIPDTGKVALQIHGNCKAVIQFRNITIEELPESTVPPLPEILRRFGNAQPFLPLPPFQNGKFEILPKETIVFTGQENMVRQQQSGELEARLALAFAEDKPVFRYMAWEADTVYQQWREVNFGDWENQLETVGATTIIAQYGKMEALDGQERLPEFIAAYHRLLDQFSAQTRRIVLLSPTPYETPHAPNAPDLKERNNDLAAYSAAIREIALQRKAVFIDLFSTKPPGRLTEDGLHPTPEGQALVARSVAESIGNCNKLVIPQSPGFQELRRVIVEKNRHWFDCWRPANWSFAYGDRVNQMFAKPSGQYPSLQGTLEKQLPVVELYDQRIHALALGQPMTIPKAPPRPEPSSPKALTPEEQLATFELADGYEANLFASEEHGVVNPVQFAWDENGRLYVACSPTYPQTHFGAQPSDYILALEDTDNNGVADESWVYADGLTMVQGVEPGKDGLYVCDFDKLLLLLDTDKDGKADQRQTLFSGFGIGDTHQLINSISHGPDGSLWFSQGLHAMSRVETPWGIARLDRSAIWRLWPKELRLEGFFGGGMAGANCWGIVHDDYGQVFHKSGDRPHGYWSVPGMVRGANPSGSGSDTEASVSYRASPQQYHNVGPLFQTSPKTTSIDIIGTQALPENIQGCAVIGGYFGAVVELHKFHDHGSGFKTTQLPKLLKASNNAFRPVDVGVGPDGAIYLADWYNPIIGHYQASYADPRRDKHHGRIWRISAKGYEPIRQPRLAAMSAAELLEQLRSPERWTRYQAKRLLYYMDSNEVLEALDLKLQNPESEDPRFLLETLGVFHSHRGSEAMYGRPGRSYAKVRREIGRNKDPRYKAYAIRFIPPNEVCVPCTVAGMKRLARDPNPRVRLEAVVASTYLDDGIGNAINVVMEALEQPTDPFLDYAIRQAAEALKPYWVPLHNHPELGTSYTPKQQKYLDNLLTEADKPPAPGEELYRLGCLACHQPEGQGLPGIYPPLTGNPALGKDKDRLIKIVLHGLSGELEVNGQTYGSGQLAVPMPPMGGLEDQQIADVLNYVRKEFGKVDDGDGITAEEVEAIREQHAKKSVPWKVEEL